MLGLGISTMAALGAGLLATGYAILGLIWLRPATRALGADILRTMHSAALIAAVIIGLTWLGGWWLYAALVLLGGRIGYEVGHVRFRPELAWVNAVFAGAVVALALFCPLPLLMVLCLICGLPAILAYLPRWPLPISGQRLAMWQQLRPALQAAAFPGWPFLLLAKGLTLPQYAPLMLLAYILVESFDGYALVSGKLLGRTPAFPRLSPRKTIEGLLGGAFMLVLTALALAWALALPMAVMAAVAGLVAALALAGDLIASQYKRDAGVKDYPVLLARQGGAFDSLDSWIAAGGGLALLAALTGGSWP